MNIAISIIPTALSCMLFRAITCLRGVDQHHLRGPVVSNDIFLGLFRAMLRVQFHKQQPKVFDISKADAFRTCGNPPAIRARTVARDDAFMGLASCMFQHLQKLSRLRVQRQLIETLWRLEVIHLVAKQASQLPPDLPEHVPGWTTVKVEVIEVIVKGQFDHSVSGRLRGKGEILGI